MVGRKGPVTNKGTREAQKILIIFKKLEFGFLYLKVIIKNLK